MNLQTAVQLVGADARDDVDSNMTDAEAVAYTRDPVTGLDAADIDGSIDPELRAAYHLVLNVSDADLAQVMA